MKLAATLPKDRTIVVNLSGRGDKDLFITAKTLAPEKWSKYLSDQLDSLMNQ